MHAPASGRALSAVLRFLLVTILALASTLIGPAGLAAASRLAYVHGSEAKPLADFVDFLTARGYVVDSVPLAQAARHDFSGTDAIIIADDTGEGATWGTEAAWKKIDAAGKLILGVGSGGYAFFGKLGLSIGWPNGAFRSVSAMNLADSSQLLYRYPGAIALDDTGLLGVYGVNVRTVDLYYENGPPAAVRTIGWDSADPPNYIPLAVEKTMAGRAYVLWGWCASPAAMTAAGKQLFINSLLRIFSDGFDAANTDWQKTGAWKLEGGSLVSPATVACTAVVKDREALGTVRLATRLKFVESSGAPSASLIFGWRDAQHYRYLRLAPGRLVVGQVGEMDGEAASVKAELAVNVKRGIWHSLTLDLRDGLFVNASLDGRRLWDLPVYFLGASARKVGLAASGGAVAFDRFDIWEESVLPAE